LSDRVGAWFAWFGMGRLLAAASCTAIVVAGGIWLLRSPTPPAEAGLPFVSASSASPTATLVEPVAVPTSMHPPRVIVHVAGAVRFGGVFELDTGDRVNDAVMAAGGATPDADLEGLNLAAPLVDGMRVYVPLTGEVDPATVATGGPQIGVPGEPVGPLDLNRATVAQFETLPGVGPATAAAIVNDRDLHGPFASVDDLDRVPGIGPSKLSALRDLVTV
jgi:competence protein ComEA